MHDDILPTGAAIEELRQEGYLVHVRESVTTTAQRTLAQMVTELEGVGVRVHFAGLRRFWVIHEEQARAIETLGKDWGKQASSVTSSKAWPMHHAPLEPPKPRPVIAKPSNNPWYRKFAK